MYQQPIPMHPAGTTTNGLYAAPQAVPVVPIQGQAGPVVDPVSGVVVGGSPNVVPGTTGTMPMVGNATVMPTTTTTAAPLVQQQYMTTLGAGLGYDRPVTTGVVPVAGGYSASTMGGYGEVMEEVMEVMGMVELNKPILLSSSSIMVGGDIAVTVMGGTTTAITVIVTEDTGSERD
ncbi:hypothetical protein AAF712_010324 [Marasmius tenuissimus]|uniref:Uncharacterized protein n=1 Tax=Marasmius tenuissimus TaxID=585030 RepID=A0ABR2ZMI7_9AGAR